VSVVLDTSAVLAMLWNEPGGARVEASLGEAVISTVNLTELVAKLVDRGGPEDGVREVVGRLGIETVAFDAEQAMEAGLMRRNTRAAGLSIGDRACIALALRKGAVALTADREWTRAGSGAAIEMIR
jgi:ribonuclease VapC